MYSSLRLGEKTSKPKEKRIPPKTTIILTDLKKKIECGGARDAASRSRRRGISTLRRDGTAGSTNQNLSAGL
ncbi:MAG TPA: hypothetical protein DEB39_08005 [Planctomycetaceae bacterium]|nr:hypothetical protein [Planctomycetaceae bacterium]